MGIFEKLRAKHQTQYVKVDTHGCVACWKCIKACPKQVLGKVNFLGHRHVRIVNANACIGCLKCVRTCPEKCFSSLK